MADPRRPHGEREQYADERDDERELAAMYMLRLISAVLHEARGSTVVEEALDLRPGELALIVPLVGVLLALSVWPAGISHHSFFGPSPAAAVKSQFK